MQSRPTSRQHTTDLNSLAIELMVNTFRAVLSAGQRVCCGFNNRQLATGKWGAGSKRIVN